MHEWPSRVRKNNVTELSLSADTFRIAGVIVVPESSDTLPHRLGGPDISQNICGAANAPGRGLHRSARGSPSPSTWRAHCSRPGLRLLAEASKPDLRGSDGVSDFLRRQATELGDQPAP